MTRILLVDDHELVRKRLRKLIHERQDWQVCGEAIDGRDAVDKHDALKPHITVMDFNMPRLNGLEAARRILVQYPSACILILSVSRTRQLVEELRHIGVRGFCPKDGIECICDALEAIIRGETYFQTLPN